MTAQCNASAECHWKQIAHSSTDNNIADLLSIYRRSVFCLCPPGDDPARKGESDTELYWLLNRSLSRRVVESLLFTSLFSIS